MGASYCWHFHLAGCSLFSSVLFCAWFRHSVTLQIKLPFHVACLFAFLKWLHIGLIHNWNPLLPNAFLIVRALRSGQNVNYLKCELSDLFVYCFLVILVQNSWNFIPFLIISHVTSWRNSCIALSVLLFLLLELFFSFFLRLFYSFAVWPYFPISRKLLSEPSVVA